MYKTTVESGCKVALGWDAMELGFIPGTRVNVIRTSVGSFIVTLDEDQVIDSSNFKPLMGGAAQKVMREAKNAVAK